MRRPAGLRVALAAVLAAAAGVAAVLPGAGCSPAAETESAAAPPDADPGADRDAARRPDVLLVTLDTTRADHLGVYGYERPTSPNLDALAAEALVYERAVSTSSWTLPAHASLFTGRYPTSHGARHDPEGALVLAREIDAPGGVRSSPMAPGEVTLAERLREAGYETAGVAGGPWLLSEFGLAAGFDHWDDEGIRNPAGRRAEAVSAAALRWLEGRPRDAPPFFLFLNYYDPHLPYLAPPSHAAAFLPPGVAPRPRVAAQSIDLYDAEILYMDHHLGRVLDRLRAAGRWDRTLVVVTGDHGELFGEHGYRGHENYLWEPLVRVPLVVKPAGGTRPRRIEERVSIVDVAPMILEAAGLPVPASVQGERPPGHGSRAAPRRPLLAEVNPLSPRQETGSWRAMWQGERKVLTSSLGDRQLFDLASDPDELDDLAPTRPADAVRAEAALERAFDALPPAPRDEREIRVAPETLEALRALGYLGDEADPPGGEPGP